MRASFPDVAFALETTALMFEVENRLYLESYLRTWDKGAEFVFQLSGSNELVVEPMVKSYGGYPVWGRYIAAQSPTTGRIQLRYVLHVHCTLRGKHRSEPIFQVEIEASSLERVLTKSLDQIKKHCNKRLVVLPVETIRTNN